MSDGAPTATRGRRLPPDERRELIVESATRLFEQRPYAQVSTVEIAEEAGIARGLLNHYFKDKRGLYLEIVRRSALLPVLEVTVPAMADAPLHEKVEAAVTWLLDSAEPQARSYATVVGAEGAAVDPEIAAILDEADDLAARRVLQLVGIDEEDATARAMVRAYGGMAKAAVREWTQKGSLTREQVHALLSDVLVHLTERVLPTSG